MKLLFYEFLEAIIYFTGWVIYPGLVLFWFLYWSANGFDFKLKYRLRNLERKFRKQINWSKL